VIGSCWHVIYTKSRHEKVVHQELMKKGIDSFLPMMRQCRQWSDRKKWVEVPMFSSYVFVHPLPAQRESVLTVAGASRYIMFNGRKAVVREHEIEFLRRVQAGETQIEIVPQTFQDKREVAITSGPFEGFKGRLLHRYSDGKIAVCLEEIGYSIVIQKGENEFSFQDDIHSEELVSSTL